MINPLSLLIASAFKNALENGYDFKNWTDEEIAIDMKDGDSEIDDYPFEEVLKYVIIQRSK